MIWTFLMNDLRKTLEKERINWKQIQVDSGNPILEDYNLDREGYPFSLLVDPNGNILKYKLSMNNLLETLKSLK